MICDRAFDAEELFVFFEENADQFSSDLHGQIERSGNGTLKQYTQKLSSKATIAYERDGDTLKGVVIGYTHDLPDNGFSYITYVIVAPQYRGKGVMRRLMAEYEEFCKKQNIPKMWLTTGKTNIGAQKAYEKCGFILEDSDSERTVKYSKVI